MRYVQPLGGAADDPYIDANPGTGVEGSAVPAAAIEHPQRELVNLISAAGLVPDPADLTQAAQAVAALIAAAAVVSHPVSAKAAAYQLGPGDRGKLLLCTGAPWSLTAPPAATLGNGWFCYVQNGSATAFVTLDPDGAEQVNGRATVPVPPRHVALLVCDGVGFRALRLVAPRLLCTASMATHSIPHSTWSAAPLTDPGVNAAGLTWAAGNPTRLTVPDGATRLAVLARSFISQAAGGNRRGLAVYRNGAEVGPGHDMVDPPPGLVHTVVRYWSAIDVVDGDYIELFHYQDSGATRTVNAGPALKVEVVEWA